MLMVMIFHRDVDMNKLCLEAHDNHCWKSINENYQVNRTESGLDFMTDCSRLRRHT